MRRQVQGSGLGRGEDGGGDTALVQDLLASLPVAKDVAVERGALGVVLDEAVPLATLLLGQAVGAEDLVDRHLGDRGDLAELVLGGAVVAEEIRESCPE